MSIKIEIKQLVKEALQNPSNKKSKISLGFIGKREANKILLKTELNLEGYERILDNFSIIHTIKTHGNEQLESKRGQIAVVDKDFEYLPEIVKSENVIYSGKNKIGNDCLLYEAKIGKTYFYVEEIRKGRRQLVLQTMYKR